MSYQDYNIEFYSKHYSGSYRSAHEILSYLKKYLSINSIVDFGCGIGTWCLVAKELEIPVVYGMDSNSLFHSQMPNLDIKYQQVDISKKVTLQQKFDLAISVEVGEHIPKTDVDIYINNLVNASNVILFSAAVPGQEGLNHVNEQPLSYWAEKFQTLHFQLIDVLRGEFWNNSEIEIWYRNNIVLFVHESIAPQTIQLLPTSKPIVDIIHPQLFERKLEKYKGSL